jgi:hypothetical protein
MNGWARSTDGGTLTRETRSSVRKICPSATLSTTIPKWTGLELNPDLNVVIIYKYRIFYYCKTFRFFFRIKQYITVLNIEQNEIHDKWVTVTAAWCVLKLRMEERPPVWRVAAYILNKQLRTADKWRSSSLGVGRSANSSLLWKCILLKMRAQKGSG